ncbi:MAG: hypothetical protein MJ188_04280 [Treponema sp.]|nr:hypothetical protein [Treponema sp.]
MKTKAFVIIFLLITNVTYIFGQSATKNANTKTAERCLKLAENFMFSNEWEKALKQSDFGLTYDDTISDLHYIKAASSLKLGATRAEVLTSVQRAFFEDNWLNYNKNGARTLYANLLSELGQYNESLELLDTAPVVFSADAEFIRIKNYYRIGTSPSIQQARAKINVARKIYENDIRFPQIFFLFEMLFMNYSERYGAPYEIPETVKVIAQDYIKNLPFYEPKYKSASEIGYKMEREIKSEIANDYDLLDSLDLIELEIIALLFSSGEEQQRLLKAVGEINHNSPLFAYVGLKAGILSEEEAYNLFFEASQNVYFLNILESFSTLLTDSSLRNDFYNQLNSFDGTLIIDENIDLRNELSIKYNRGRPEYIYFDKNNDQIVDIYAVCDFGVPTELVFYDDVAKLNYKQYPFVEKINFVKNDVTYGFFDRDFSFEPFEIITDRFFLNYSNCNFFIPYIQNDVLIPEDSYLAKKASTIEITTKERSNSKVVYTVYEGKPVFADFSNNSKKFAYSTIETGVPFVRYVDYDEDGFFETAETFDFANEIILDNTNYVSKIFGENSFSKQLYLKKIEIDRNQNTISEFMEEYLSDNGKVSSWDNDEDSFFETIYIRYPDNQEEDFVKEDTIFYDDYGNKKIVIHSENNEPKTLELSSFYKNGSGEEHSINYEIIPGTKDNYYWLNEEGGELLEQKIAASLSSNPQNGAVQIVSLTENIRCSVIKIDKNIFCNLISDFDVTE